MKILMEKRKITSLLVNVIVIKMLLTYPRYLILRSGNAAWIEIIYVTLIALGIFLITAKIYEKAGRQDVIQIADKIGGKWLKRALGILLAAALMLNMAFTVRAFPESIKTVLLEMTPMHVIIVFFVIVAALGAYMGIEAVARIHVLFMPIAGTIFLIYFLLSIRYWNFNNIFPLLGTGVYNIFVKGFNDITIFADIILLNLLLPFCDNVRDAKRSGIFAILIGGIICLAIIGTYTFIYPYPASKEFVLPMYQISRIVNLGTFFQRWDAFFQFIWSIAMYLYASVYLIIIAYILVRAFDLKYYKPLIFPIMIIVAAVSFNPQSINGLLNRAILVYPFIYPILFLTPIVFGILYRFKTRTIEKSE